MLRIGKAVAGIGLRRGTRWSSKLRDELEKTLEQAADEAVRNPLPVDVQRVQQQEFREQRAKVDASKVSGLDRLLGTVDSPKYNQEKAQREHGATWPGNQETLETDLPDFMKAEVLDEPLADGGILDGDEPELPSFMKNSPSPRVMHEARAQPMEDVSPKDTPKAMMRKKRAKLHSLSEINDPELDFDDPDLPRQGAPKEDSEVLPSFLRDPEPEPEQPVSSTTSTPSPEPKPTLPSFLNETKDTQPPFSRSSEGQTPPRTPASPRSGRPLRTQQLPVDDNDLPDLMKPDTPPQRSTGTPQRAKQPLEQEDDEDLPDFLKSSAQPPKSSGKPQSTEKPPFADDLPDFLKDSSDQPPKSSGKPQSTEKPPFADDLPDFLKDSSDQPLEPSNRPQNHEPEDDDGLPDFLKSSDQPPKRSGRPQKHDTQSFEDNDGLPDFLKGSAQPPKSSGGPQKLDAQSFEDDDLPDFLKSSGQPPRSADRPQQGKKQPLTESEDELPDFLKNPSAASAQETKQPPASAQPVTDKPQSSAKVSGTHPARRRMLNANQVSQNNPPARSRPQRNDPPAAQRRTGDNSDLPDFLKEPTKSRGQTERPQFSGDDNDLPDFLKESTNQPRGRAEKPQVSDDDDLPDFLRSSSAPPSSQRRESNEPRGSPRSSNAPSSDRSGSGRPQRMESNELRGRPQDVDDDLPDFLKEPTNQSRGRAEKLQVSDDDDLPDFLRSNSAPPTGTRSSGREELDDDLPDFLKSDTPPPSRPQKPSETPQRNDDDLPEFLKSTPSPSSRSRDDDKDDDLPDFLKSSSNSPPSRPQGPSRKQIEESAPIEDSDMSNPPSSKSNSAPTRGPPTDDVPDFLKGVHDDDEIPDFLKNSSPKNYAMPEDSDELDIEPVQPVKSAEPQSTDDLPEFLKSSPSSTDDDLPPFLQNGASEKKVAVDSKFEDSDSDLPSFLKSPPEAFVKGSASSDDDLPAFLKETKPAAGKGLFDDNDDDLPDFLKSEKPAGKPVPPPSTPPMDAAQVRRHNSLDDVKGDLFQNAQQEASPTKPLDDDLPDFLKEYSKNMDNTNSLPDFLKFEEKPRDNRRGNDKSQYMPPPYDQPMKGEYKVALDDTKATSALRVLDELTVESVNGQSWQGLRATHAATKGKVAFGIKVLWGRLCRVGWSVAGSSLELGSGPGGFGYGATAKKSTNREYEDYGAQFSAGDTVHALVDFSTNEISFALNGKHLGVAYDIPEKYQGQPLYPHILTKDARVRMLFGEADSEGVPEGMIPLASQCPQCTTM
eukprot:TRINITY_DN4228_c0_g1_i2.p1 TRINITY_DN4228_c0_g1~~TRINITY_DN4228_c0_g1_i2.p1  ORF type:complete len:1272 (+),score=269.08 TRINITY_DN4228_c0_g1_i2:48-3863(+)